MKELYTSAFPVNEQIPMPFLLWKAKKAFVDFLAFYDEGQFVGFIYLITNNDLTLVLFVAVNSKIQSKGYGGKIMNHVKILYPNNRIILNIEALDECAGNNEQRIKRRAFYIKNGYNSSGIIVADKVATFETLITNGTCKIEEYQALVKRFMGSVLYALRKPAFSYSGYEKM